MAKTPRAGKARKPQQRSRRPLLVAAALLPVAAGGFVLWTLPALEAEHRWSVAASADQVYDQYSDFAAHPQWRRDLSRVELIEHEGAYPRFIEYRRYGEAHCEVKEAEFPWRLAWQCRGAAAVEYWQLMLEPDGARTMVRLSRRLDLDSRRLGAWVWRWQSADLSALATDLSERL